MKGVLEELTKQKVIIGISTYENSGYTDLQVDASQRKFAKPEVAFGL